MSGTVRQCIYRLDGMERWRSGIDLCGRRHRLKYITSRDLMRLKGKLSIQFITTLLCTAIAAYGSTVSVLHANQQIYEQYIKLDTEIKQYQLHGLVPGRSYEARVSHPASVSHACTHRTVRITEVYPTFLCIKIPSKITLSIGDFEASADRFG